MTRVAYEDTDVLEEIRANVRVIAVKLFGSSDGEREEESGRLPVIERRLNDHGERIKLLEGDRHKPTDCPLNEQMGKIIRRGEWFERLAWLTLIALLGGAVKLLFR